VEPDPIRQAFVEHCERDGVHPPFAKESDFTAGAKWAARESAKLHENVDPACDHNADGCGAMHAIIQYRDEIRKHFGLEAP